MSDFPVIRTPRLILRELCPADVPALFAIHSDADAMQWFGTDPITDYPQAEQLLALFASWRSLPNPARSLRPASRREPSLAGFGVRRRGRFSWACLLFQMQFKHRRRSR